MFTVQGPDGQTYSVDAPDPQSAATAVEEMVAGEGGQRTMRGSGMFDDLIPGRSQGGQGGQSAPQQSPAGQPQGFADLAGDAQRFGAAFDPSQDRPELAAAMDSRVNSEADNRGRAATIGNALTLGFGDEALGVLAGGLTWAQGEGFDKGYNAITTGVRKDIANYAERRPVEHAALDIAASIPTAIIPGGAAVRGASLAGKVARGAAAGAAYGAAQGYGEGEGGVGNRLEQAAVGGAVGGGIGGAVPVAGAAVGRAVGRRAGNAAVPSVEQLDDAAKALYQRADNAGIAIQPKAAQRLTTVLPQRLANMGFDPVLHPRSARALQVIEERVTQAMQPTGGATTVLSLGEVENMRRVIRQAISSASGPDSKADRQMANRILDQFDTWMTGLQPRDMLAGGPNGMTGREAIQVVQEARSLWTRKSKGDVLADLVERAQLDDDFEKGIRREFRTLSRNKERMRQFTAGEKDAIRKVARGGDMGWLTRALGSFSPTSLGGAAKSGVVGGLGVATGNPVAVALPAVGYAAQKVGGATTRSALRKADTMVRAGGTVPIDAKAAKTGGDYATRLIGAAAQATAPRPDLQIMFPNDAPVYR